MGRESRSRGGFIFSRLDMLSAARTAFSHHSKASAEQFAPRRISGRDHNDVEHTTRKPMLLLKLSGSFLLRYEQRALFRLLFHEPPRTTRACS
jgi:hypothetical protein